MSRLTDWHRIVLLGAEPTPEQQKLYDKWPMFKGFSDRAENTAIAEAVIVLALSSGPKNAEVVVLAPHAMESWLLKQIEAVAVRLFEACPERYPDRPKEMINGFTQLFRKIKMTGRVLQIRQEPEHWVSFGFAADDTLPAWMDGRLLAL